MHECGLMMTNARHMVSSIGSTAADLASRVGGGTADLAKRVGPKRGLLGLLAAGAAIGGAIYLVRYLRSRAVEKDADGAGKQPMRSAKMERAGARAAARADIGPEPMSH